MNTTSVIIPKRQLIKLVALMVTLISLGRCFEISGRIAAVAIIAALLFLAILCRKIYLTYIDWFFLPLPFLALFNRYEAYPMELCAFYVIAWLGLYAFRTDKMCFDIVLKCIWIFSVINVLVNIINLLYPEMYFGLLDIVLKEPLPEIVRVNYGIDQYLCGLSDHYSRNAYFCVAGCLVALAYLWGGRDKNKWMLFVLISDLLMLLRIGKRGHLLFLLAAAIFTYIMLEAKLSKKLVRLLKFVLVLVLGYGFIIEFIPSVGFVFERFSESSKGDYSTGRFELWKIAYELFLEAPYFGKGYGYFSTNVFNSTIGVFFSGVHNDYLQWLCEQGIVGTIFNLASTIFTYLLSLKVMKNIIGNKCESGTDERVAIIWSILFQTFVITYSLTGLPHFDYEINIIYYISMAVPYFIISKDEVCRQRVGVRVFCLNLVGRKYDDK